jgi:outer membrane protein assembly factor BamB
LLVYHPTSLDSLNPETGEVFWRHPVKVSLGQSIMSPQHHEGRVYVSSALYGTTALALKEGEPGVDLALAKRAARGGPDSGLYVFFSTPFIEGDISTASTTTGT